MTRPRDGQQSALYTWEKSIADWQVNANKKLSLAECQDLVNRVWYCWIGDGPRDPAPPKVTSRRGGRGYATAISVQLPTWTRFLNYVLHEVAHSIECYHDKEGLRPAHGPVYARLLLDLLVQYAGADAAAARKVRVSSRTGGYSYRRVRFASDADRIHSRASMAVQFECPEPGEQAPPPKAAPTPPPTHGECKCCRRVIELDPDRLLHAHGVTAETWYGRCKGSWEEPAALVVA